MEWITSPGFGPIFSRAPPTLEAISATPAERIFSSCADFGRSLLRKNAAVHEMLLKLLQELIQGSSSGLSQIDVDRVNSAFERARSGLPRSSGITGATSIR